MKKIIFTISLTFSSLFGFAQCPDNCDAVLLLGFNEFEIFTQNDLNSAYAEMFTKSDTELDEISNQSSSGSGISGKYKVISASWSKNKNNSSWRKEFNESREAYQKSGVLNTGFIQESASKTVNNETVTAWRNCKKDLFECIKELNEDSGNSSFTTEIAGDLNSNFTLIIHFNPNNQGENRPTKISSVSYSPNLVLRQPNNLIKDEFIQPYTGLSQSFTRINKDLLSSITINIEGSSPIIVNLPADNKASSGVPIGTIIASSLTYPELCESLGEKVTYDNKNTWAPADGRGVSGSIYGDIHNSVPDLRGVFLRGLNKFYQDNNGSGTINPNQLDVDNTRNAGSFQPESTKIPENGFKTSLTGKHSHSTIQMIGDNNIDGVDSTTSRSGDHHNETKTTGDSGEHEHTIIGGDKETRPKNVAVYYYIKIN